MNIFTSNDYREILSQLIKERREIDPDINFQNLAMFMRVPKSYLSRVIHGGADLSPDQIFLASNYLSFTVKERDYLLLLVDFSRAGLKQRKDHLLSKIRAIQSEALDTKENLKSVKLAEVDTNLYDYYLDPKIQLVHVCLTVPRYRKNLTKLSQDLQISNQQLLKILTKLEQIKLITRMGDEVKVLVENIHLPKSSPVYRMWRNSLKLLSMQHIDSLDDEEAYSFSVVFSSNDDSKRLIHRKFIDFLKEVEEIATSGKQENVYNMTFELFPWTK